MIIQINKDNLGYLATTKESNVITRRGKTPLEAYNHLIPGVTAHGTTADWFNTWHPEVSTEVKEIWVEGVRAWKKPESNHKLAIENCLKQFEPLPKLVEEYGPGDVFFVHHTAFGHDEFGDIGLWNGAETSPEQETEGTTPNNIRVYVYEDYTVNVDFSGLTEDQIELVTRGGGYLGYLNEHRFVESVAYPIDYFNKPIQISRCCE